MKQAESERDFTTRLAAMEEAKSMQWSAIWDFYRLSRNVPVGIAWLDEVKTYEPTVLSKRKAA